MITPLAIILAAGPAEPVLWYLNPGFWDGAAIVCGAALTLFVVFRFFLNGNKTTSTGNDGSLQRLDSDNREADSGEDAPAKIVITVRVTTDEEQEETDTPAPPEPPARLPKP